LQRRAKWLVYSLLFLILVFLTAYAVTLAVLPGDITILAGENYNFYIRSPLFIQAYSRSNRLKISSEEGSGDSFERPYTLVCHEPCQVEMDYKILGFIPVKTVQVRSIANRSILACGYPIGIKMKTSGVMVINVSGVIMEDGSKVSPADKAGILAGDIIVMAGGRNIASIKDLISVIEDSGGKDISITFLRKNERHDTTICPVKSAEDTQYRIGVWVRDSSAGIGTLTFIDPVKNIYGALGHGINDIDTGSLLQVGSGQLLKSSIRSIKKGVKGKPGELEGDFLERMQVIGDIELNCEFGVYGRIQNGLERGNTRLLEIGSHSMVHPGKASILACIKGEEVEEFEIEIEKIAKWDLSSSKNMVICITDERLLETTGGIVQGMSGSPIIQDGRIIGAVTHVFINDPMKGYGVFIESMLDQVSALENSKPSLPAASGF
jgi:stage IV sporulation protein B